MRLITLHKKKLYVDREGVFLPVNLSILQDDLMLKFIVQNRPNPYIISTSHAKEVVSKYTFMNKVKVALIPLSAVSIDLGEHYCSANEIDQMRAIKN